MYLSSVYLNNWRSYRDARFDFKPPSKRRPIVLIGAMNGHGKTSFLLALYLGLYGRFGLRHAEGFAHAQPDDFSRYRDAISKFRRTGAPSDEPTSIELVFSPSDEDGDAADVRIVRRWYFTSTGNPKQGDAFEAVDLYIGGRPQRLTNTDAAHDRLERLLFPASFMPAFFFDGEQAQQLINNAGETGIRKAVEVLFGTRILEDLDRQVKRYIDGSRTKIGGAKNVTAQQKALDEKVEERQKLEEAIKQLQRQEAEVDEKGARLAKEHQGLTEKLSRLGGANRVSVEEIQQELSAAEDAVRRAEEALTNHASRLGVGLAISRLGPTLKNQLHAEALLEQWEGLRHGTLSRADEVLKVALPEPPENDDLLGYLNPPVRERVKERFRHALEQIYNPPPNGCAKRYHLGHVKGEMRERLVGLIEQVQTTSAATIQADARRLKLARDVRQDAEAKRARLSDLPKEIKELSDKIADTTSAMSECSRQLGSIEREIASKKGALEVLNREIGALREKLSALGPDQQRIAIAERVHRTLGAINQQLRPVTLRRLEELVSGHFTSIADRRFKNATIAFPDGGPPLLKRPNHTDQHMEMMGGFERRSFGIAFSLSLAEMTQRRIPLVVDTPLGNADTEYRPRLLKALRGVDLDQIIILTHDAEVTADLFEGIESHVQQTFLVQYDRDRRESLVTADAFFNGIGR